MGIYYFFSIAYQFMFMCRFALIWFYEWVTIEGWMSSTDGCNFFLSSLQFMSLCVSSLSLEFMNGRWYRATWSKLKCISFCFSLFCCWWWPNQWRCLDLCLSMFIYVYRPVPCGQHSEWVLFYEVICFFAEIYGQ